MQDGVKPSPDKIKAIEQLEPPKDKKELQTSLEMATYMSSLIPKLPETRYANIERELLAEVYGCESSTPTFTEDRLWSKPSIGP